MRIPRVGALGGPIMNAAATNRGGWVAMSERTVVLPGAGLARARRNALRDCRPRARDRLFIQCLVGSTYRDENGHPMTWRRLHHPVDCLALLVFRRDL